MKSNHPKNVQLIKQFPFVKSVLGFPMEPFAFKFGGVFDEERIDDLTIRVEKADADLMFRQAENTGLREKSFILHLKGRRKDQVMRRGEYLFAVDGEGRVINQVNWPRNNEERREMGGEVYAWSVFWQARKDNLYSRPIHTLVKHLVWATVEAWHQDTKDDDHRFGRFLDRSVHLTVYTAPAKGFEKLQEEANIWENLSLDSKTLIRGGARGDHDLITMSGMLYEMCIWFQDLVYFNGMKKVLDEGKVRGASGQFGQVRVLAAEMCGYDRIMLEDAVSWISFQLRPGSKNMYVLGEKGTLPQIRNLVRTVIKLWGDPRLRQNFKADQEVSVM